MPARMGYGTGKGDNVWIKKFYALYVAKQVERVN